jgi:hypothetical protein
VEFGEDQTQDIPIVAPIATRDVARLPRRLAVFACCPVPAAISSRTGDKDTAAYVMRRVADKRLWPEVHFFSVRAARQPSSGCTGNPSAAGAQRVWFKRGNPRRGPERVHDPTSRSEARIHLFDAHLPFQPAMIHVRVEFARGLRTFLGMNPHHLRLLMHCARRPASRAACSAGKSSAINTAMIAITTSSSISVKPPRYMAFLLRDPSALRKR